MKKSLLAIILVLVMVFAVTSCNGSENDILEQSTSPYESSPTQELIIKGEKEIAEYKTFTSVLGYSMNYFFNIYPDVEFAGNLKDSETYWLVKADGTLPSIYVKISVESGTSALDLSKKYYDEFALLHECGYDKSTVGTGNYEAVRLAYADGEGENDQTHMYYFVPGSDRVFVIEIASCKSVAEDHGSRIGAMLSSFTILK